MNKVLAVWKIDPLKKSQYKPYPYRLVVFKDIKNGNKTVKMYLDQKNTTDANYANWMNNLKEGVVLGCSMYPNGNVNPYAPFKYIKGV